MRQIFLSLVLCLVFGGLYSCNKTGGREFPATTVAEVDTVMIGEITMFERIVNDGEFLYAISSRTDSSLFIYSLPDLKFIASGLPKGQGPGEVQYGPLLANSNTRGVWMLGFTPGELRRFELRKDSIVAVDTAHFGQIMIVNDLIVLNDSVALFNEFPACCEIYRMTADNSSTKSFKYSDEKVTGSNSPNRASFASNSKISAIVFSYIDKIIFLDPNTLQVIKTAGDGTSLNSEQTGGLPFYSAARATTDAIYVQKVVSENNAVIEIYDNDGNPVQQIQIPMAANTFTVDETNKCLILYSDDQPDRFFKVKI